MTFTISITCDGARHRATRRMLVLSHRDAAFITDWFNDRELLRSVRDRLRQDFLDEHIGNRRITIAVRADGLHTSLPGRESLSVYEPLTTPADALLRWARGIFPQLGAASFIPCIPLPVSRLLRFPVNRHASSTRSKQAA